MSPPTRVPKPRETTVTSLAVGTSSALNAVTVIRLAPSASGTSAVNAPPAGVASTTVAPARTCTRVPSVVPRTVAVVASTTAPSAGAVTVRAGGGVPGPSTSLICTLRKNTSSPVPWFCRPIRLGAFIRFGSVST